MPKRTMRSSIKIMVEILKLCKLSQSKTRIMYNTNLSWEMLQRYLARLESRGLLEVHHSQIKYATTKKGLEFIEKCDELTKFL